MLNLLKVVIGQLARATLVQCDVYDNDVSEVMMQPFKDPPGNMKRWLVALTVHYLKQSLAFLSF